MSELRQIVALDRQAGAQRTDTVRGLAARSALLLSEEQFHAFQAVQLLQPFDQSLQEKQRRMNLALASLSDLVDYQVGEVTAAATFYMAEIYGDFSRSLLESERPNDLSGAELADYEGVLEEEAFPFEEKSIAVHQKNLELMGSGLYNPWIEKSLDRLAILMPGRYAKPEESSGPLAFLEIYAYRIPGFVAAATIAPEASTAQTSEPVNVPPQQPDPDPSAVGAVPEESTDGMAASNPPAPETNGAPTATPMEQADAVQTEMAPVAPVDDESAPAADVTEAPAVLDTDAFPASMASPPDPAEVEPTATDVIQEETVIQEERTDEQG